MNVRFLNKKPVRKNMECVLDRSILERVPVFLERFFFLKKVNFFFGTRSIPFFFINIFHWVFNADASNNSIFQNWENTKVFWKTW